MNIPSEFGSPMLYFEAAARMPIFYRSVITKLEYLVTNKWDLAWKSYLGQKEVLVLNRI